MPDIKLTLKVSKETLKALQMTEKEFVREVRELVREFIADEKANRQFDRRWRD